MFKWFHVFYFLLTFLSIFSNQASSLTCGNQQLKDKNITHNGLEHPYGSYGNQIQECVCELGESKPCIPFCCPPGYIKKENFATSCEPYEHVVYLNTSNQIGYVENRIEEKFRIVDGRSCSKSFYAKDEIDSWLLLEVLKLKR